MAKPKTRIKIGDTGYMCEIDCNRNHELFRWYPRREVENQIKQTKRIVEAGWQPTNRNYGNLQMLLHAIGREHEGCEEIGELIERMERFAKTTIKIEEL